VTSEKTGSDVKDNLETEIAKICIVYKITGKRNNGYLREV
jgi:hypothetical protein